MPNLRAQKFGGEDHSWLVNGHALRDGITASLKVATFKGQAKDGQLLSGTPVDYSDPGDLKPFTDAAGAKLGFILHNHAITGILDTNINVAVLVHGIVHAEKVPGEFTAPATADAGGFTFVKGEAS